MLSCLIPDQTKGARALNDEAINEIYRLKKDFPRMNATQIHDFLIRNSFIPATVSVDSVQRFIRHNDLKSARDPNLRDRKAYEEDEFMVEETFDEEEFAEELEGEGLELEDAFDDEEVITEE